MGFSKIMRTAQLTQEPLYVKEEILRNELEALITERRGREITVRRKSCQTIDSYAANPLKFAPAQVKESPSTATEYLSGQTPSPSQKLETDSPAIYVSQDKKLSSLQLHLRDAGVSDADWIQLQQDQKKAEAREKEYEDLVTRCTEVENENQVLNIEIEKTAQILKTEEAAKLDQAKRPYEEEWFRKEIERSRLEEELARLVAEKKEREEERKKEQRAQQRLKFMGLCVAGYIWIKQQSGYRCAGGSHFVSDIQLGIN